MKLDQEQIIQEVKNGTIRNSCFGCKDEFAVLPPYDGTLTLHTGECDICGKIKPIGNARKCFGYYRMV